VTPAEVGLAREDFPEEDGESYRANAILKARAAAQATGLVALGEDSGLEIDALGGTPGPLSARFLGPEATYQERFRYILERLQGLPPERRSARFRCLMAVAAPGREEVHVVEGICSGFIALEPRGEGGFGYDPIFYLPARMATMAELPLHEKNVLSHRAQAAWRLRPLLRQLLYRWEGR